MTREEAIKELSVEYLGDSEKIKEAKRMAIKVLEQQPCEDCISREAVLEVQIKYAEHMGATKYWQMRDDIRALPSVTPQPKIGRWLMPQQDDGMSDPIYYQVRCSECGFDLDPQTWHMELHQYGADKYCPNCGARMAESEGKE